MSSVMKTQAPNTRTMGSFLSVISSNVLFQRRPVPKNPDLIFLLLVPHGMAWEAFLAQTFTKVPRVTKM